MAAAKNYIPHIDGMRAISVVAVIFFHFHLLGFTGGYIGVDVFFTISGYLIIGSIVGQAQAGKFRASDFWGRRIRRLFPAIFAVLFLSFLAGLLLMSPADLVKLARDSLYGLVSLINFTLLAETDYFDLQGFNEPLLHFWSLAVEEQFYLVFPLIALAVLALSRGSEQGAARYKSTIVWVLIVLSIISLVAAEAALRTGNSLVAYYMMPTRFFQLALGGVLAIWLQSDVFRARREALPRVLHDCLVFSAITLIIFLSLVFTKTTPFPGINAIWPTLAALALLFSGGLSRLSPILENPLSAHLGKLSYSLYLVHWPVWTFMAYYLDRLPDLPETMLAIALTYIISFVIYRFVETPVRFAPAFKGKRVFAAVLPVAVVSGLAFGATIEQGGWVQRIPEAGQDFIEGAETYHRKNYGGEGFAISEPVHLGHPRAVPEFIIMGDSKTGQFAYGLDKLLKERNRAALMYLQNGCAFVPGHGKLLDAKRIETCLEFTDRTYTDLSESQLPLISVRSWSAPRREDQIIYRYEQDGSNVALSMDEVLQQHAAQIVEVSQGRDVFVVGDNDMFTNVNYQNVPIASCLSRPTYFGLPCSLGSATPTSELSTGPIEYGLRDLSLEMSNVHFVDAANVYCDDGYCRKIAKDGSILFSDAGHLSKQGSLIAAKNLIEYVELADTFAAPLGEVLTVEEIQGRIVAAWDARDDAALRPLLEEYLVFAKNFRTHHDFIDRLWNGREDDGRIAKNRKLAVPIAEYISGAVDESYSTYVAGFAYWWGEGGVEKDFGKALGYWTKPSQDSNAVVQFRVAEILLNADSPQFDEASGLERMRRAAEMGHTPAIEWLAAADGN